MKKRNLKIWKVPHLSGGLNTRDAKNVIPPTQSPDLLNMEWDLLGRVTRRGGFRQHIMDSFDPSPCYGLFRYVKANMDKYLMTVFGTRLIAYKGDSPTYEKHEVRNDLTDSIERFFAQQTDNVYMSAIDVVISGTSWGTSDTNRPIRWNGTETQYMGHDIFGYTRQGAVTATPGAAGTGRMKFDVTGNTEYLYQFANVYGGLGESPLIVSLVPESSYAPYGYVAGITGGAASPPSTFSFTLSGFNAAIDPLATKVRIYRTLNISAVSGGSPSAYYFIAEVDAGTNSYVDQKNDNELIELAPEQPLYERTMFPKFKYIASHKSRIFIANCQVVDSITVNGSTGVITPDDTSIQPTRLYWSDLYQPDRLMGFVEVGSDRDKITFIISFNNTLVIGKESTIHALYGSGPSDFVVREVNAGLGCIAPRSVAILDNVLIFLGNDSQFHAFDGVNFRTISEAIRPTLDALETSRIGITAGGVSGGRYFGSVPRDEA